MNDLKAACLWCTSEEDMVAAVRKLAEQGNNFIKEVGKQNSKHFLNHYVLHRDDGQCVKRAISFLSSHVKAN